MNGHLLVVTVALAAVLTACGSPHQGIGEPVDPPVSEADVAEVRAVVAGHRDVGSPGERWQRPPSPFGADAEPLGTLTGPVLEELVAAVSEASYIDTGDVVYDLANPDYEVVFLAANEELVRLGYYAHTGRWGEYEVPGRWMDEHWQLLAMTFELPEELTGPS